MKVGLYLSCYPELDNRQAPLGLGYLAAFAKRDLPHAEFIIENDLSRLIEAKPDLVGFSILTKMASLANRQACQVKDALGCPILCGGPHITALPATLADPFDVAVLGEGEQTFSELLRLYSSEGKFSGPSLSKIRGIAYRDAGAVVRTPERPFFENLDDIPPPNRAILLDKWPHPGREYSIMTSRGCPYQCSFCSTALHWGRRYRYHSSEYVAVEIETLRREHNPKILKVWDDLFIANKQRTRDLLGLIRKRRLHEGMEFTCFVRANLLEDEIMESLAQTNFRVLNIGFEACSDDILNTLNKQGVQADTNRRAADLARRHGLQFSATFILGVPGETREDIAATFDFITSNLDVFTYAEFVPLEVFPGTRVWDWAKKIGISEQNLQGVLFDTEDIRNPDSFYLHRWPYLNEAKMPREEILNFLRIGRQISRVVSLAANQRQQVGRLAAECAARNSPEHIAANIPLSNILGAKLRRRLQRAPAAKRDVPAPASSPIDPKTPKQ